MRGCLQAKHYEFATRKTRARSTIVRNASVLELRECGARSNS